MVPQPELNTPYTQNNYNEAGLHSLWGVHFPSIPSEWALPHPGTLTVTAVTETGTIQLNITSSIRCSPLLFHQISLKGRKKRQNPQQFTACFPQVEKNLGDFTNMSMRRHHWGTVSLQIISNLQFLAQLKIERSLPLPQGKIRSAPTDNTCFYEPCFSAR